MSEEDNNPYEAPEAVLTTEQTGTHGGSIEQTLDGRAELDFGDVISEAWRLTPGIKRLVLIPGIITFVGLVGLSALVFGTGLMDPGSMSTGEDLVLQFVIGVLMYPVIAGVFMICIRQSVGAHVEFGQAWMYFSSIATLAAIAILTQIATSIGMLLLILPGIYLSIALMLAIPLHVEKGLGVIECLITSLKLVNAKFLTVLLLIIAQIIGIVLGFVTLIGWIWLVPWSVMVTAIIYRQLAGVENV